MGPAILETMTLLRKQGLTVEGKKAQRAAIEAVVKAADPRGRVLSEKDWARSQQEQQGVFYDAGVRAAFSNHGWRITALVKGSPAESSFFKPGDLIEAVDGVLLASQKVACASAPLRSATNAPVRLKVKSALDGVERELELSRVAMPAAAIEAAENWPFRLAYLRLNGLYEGSAKDIAARVQEWARAGYFGLVLDLRGANGMSLRDAADVAGLWADSGATLFKFTAANGKELNVFKARSQEPVELTVIALVDGETSEASEVLAATLAGSVRCAMLIGQPTCGDPRIRELLPLPSGDRIYAATRRLVTGDGRRYDGREGVVPDIRLGGAEAAAPDYEPEPLGGRSETLPAERDDRLLRERVRGDAALQRAVDILRGLKTLNQRALVTEKNSAR
ncbi:MAG: S41 family peptidase [Kiritimatiellaeota bacterium]|nr:S41 family peptidase [Kiritimatiellota bacterium]